MIKDNELKYRGVTLFLFIGLFALVAVKVQVAFDTSAQLKVKEVIKAYDAHSNTLTSSVYEAK